MFDASQWFDSPAGPTCLEHGRSAESVCSRCGAFECDWCVTREAAPYCSACALYVSTAALPKLSFRAAWKLLFVPVLGIASLLVLASRGTLLTVLASHQFGFMALWLVPFLCGLWLLTKPAPVPALIGSVVAVALVGLALVPPLMNDVTAQRITDLVLLSAGPLAAFRDACALGKAERTRMTLWAFASHR